MDKIASLIINTDLISYKTDSIMIMEHFVCLKVNEYLDSEKLCILKSFGCMLITLIHEAFMYRLFIIINHKEF
ncbi:hypothetical protein BpHYR1_032325 [Brachionus plicatilis]|uniref:Uncharacterized protein n=1 Tax=Brachionus plicatilis TaxID=10195 RepID=A0A3M7T161_BRAPC|nr:hypothetical protein BpHYR1_032325 [Brachionus plicatilis]